MTDKQKEAVKIILAQCYEGHLDADEALTIIDSIVGEPQIQYIPWTTEPAKPSWPLGPVVTYGTGTPPFTPGVTSANDNGYRPTTEEIEILQQQLKDMSK